MLNWTKKPPEDSGEYLFMSYMECGCCVDIIGYCHIYKRDETTIDKNSSIYNYDFTDSNGKQKRMSFEGVDERGLPIANGKILGGYFWAQFNPPSSIKGGIYGEINNE